MSNQTESATTVDWINTTGEWNISNGNDSEGYCGTGQSKQQRLKEILAVLVSVVMAIIMVGMGCSLHFKKIVQHLRKPVGIIIALACQFVIMPVLGYIWAKIFNMDDPETLSVLLMGSCPGGTTSNLASYWIGGDMELSATMTMVSVILSLGAIPLLLYIYRLIFAADTLAVPYESLGIALALIIVPLSIGTFINYKNPRVAKKLLKASGIIGMIAMLVLIGLGVPTFYCFWSVSVGQLVTAICFPVTGAMIGYVISSALSSVAKPLYLHHYQRRTISAETGIQNVQIATTIIQLAGWPLDVTGRIMMVPLLYAATQIGWCVIAAVVYRIFVRIRHRSTRNSGEADEENASPKSTAYGGEINPVFESRDEGTGLEPVQPEKAMRLP